MHYIYIYCVREKIIDIYMECIHKGQKKKTTNQRTLNEVQNFRSSTKATKK